MAKSSAGRTEVVGRPIHRACVFAGCPCQPGDAISSIREARPAAATRRSSGAAAAGSPDIAWRTVGLPVA